MNKTTILLLSVFTGLLSGLQPLRAQLPTTGVKGDTLLVARFDTQADFDRFTTFTTDPSGSTWVWNANGHAESGGEYRGLPSNKWLVTPALQLDKNYLYKVQVDVSMIGAGWPGRMEVMLGSDAAEAALTTTLIDPLDITWEGYVTQSVNFSTATSGQQYIALHNITGVNLPGFVADNLIVERLAALAAPDSVKEATVTAGPEAAHRVAISFTTPTRQADGQPLTAIERAELWRNGELIKTFLSPAIGESLQYVDDAVSEEGNYTYSMVCHNAAGRGIVRHERVFVGYDTPLPPADITLSDAGDHLLLTWQHPGNVGMNGGYVEDDLTYDTYTINGMYANYWERNVRTTTYNISFNPDTGSQGFLIFGASAHGKGGDSYIFGSNELLVGKPYALPYRETFTNGYLESLFWMDGPSVMNVDTNNSVDGDRGSLIFRPTNLSLETTINTGKISTSQSEDYKLIFYHYGTPKNNMQIIVEGRGADNVPVELGTIDYRTLTGAAQWRKAVISLTPLAGERYIVLGFHFKGEKTGTTIAIDNLNVGEFPTKDLAVDLNVGLNGEKGVTTKATVNISNVGESDVSYYNVEVSMDDEVLLDSTVTETLRSMETLPVEVPFRPSGALEADRVQLTASVLLPGDRNSSNNHDNVTVRLSDNDLPTVTDLRAQDVDHGIRLTWQAPDNQPIRTVEGFEDYEPWTTEGFGRWLTTDRDGLTTFPMFAGYWFPTQSRPMAFMVHNPEALELVKDNFSNYWPKTGKQCLLSVAPDNTNSEADDWLVSPELDGTAQTLKFSAMSAFSSRLESIEVLFSTSDTELESFTTVGRTIESVPAAWTTYSIDVPEGVKYFAIHVYGRNKYVLLLDDVNYTAAARHPEGYALYVDHRLKATLPATTHSYDIEVEAPDTHTYQVTALYAEGESRAAEVSLANGIILRDYTPSTVQTYDLQGRRIVSPSRRGTVTILRDNDAKTSRKVIR